MSDEAPQSNVSIRAELLKNEAIDAPALLDVFVVGAGVAGTAAAFRATELGLKTVVIDRDDILELLRSWAFDYEPPKLVDANYNAQARKTPFPQGADLVACLEYEDRSRSPDLYNRWVGCYIERKIPIRSGMELTDLQDLDDGTIEVTCRRASDTGIKFRAKAVILAIGAGTPNTLPIPGDVGGIPASVGAGTRFLGGPACVLGGGTSAAEAVIRIANMKKEAGDTSQVYWCFRSQALPKVNDTLNESLGTALAAGVMQAVPVSNAMAVLDERSADGESTKQFVIVRHNRTKAENKPYTSDYLEFEKERVLACLGSAPQTDFLAGLGIEELEVVDQDEEGMAVSPWFESARKNVFLVGEPLAPSYIQTTDFDPNADQAVAVQQAACFKNSMRNGVLAVEAVAARQAGTDDAGLKKLMLDLDSAWREGFTPTAKKVDADKPPEKPREPVARFAQLQESGEVVRNMPMGTASIIQASGDVMPGADRGAGATYLKLNPDSVYVCDPDNRGETLIQVGVERTIDLDTIFMAGEQRFRVIDVDGKAKLAVLGPDNQPKASFEIPPEGTDFGRKESSSVVCIASNDFSLSRRHFRVQGEGNLFALRDYGSVNGTYVTVTDADAKLVKGDVVWAGDHRFRFDGIEAGDAVEPATQSATVAAPAAPAPPTTEPATVDAESLRAAAAPPAAQEPATKPAPAEAPAAPAAPAAPPPAAAGGAPSLQVAPAGQTVELNADKTLLDNLIDAGSPLQTKDAAEAEANKSLLWSCHGAPSCFFCIIKVLSGGEHLSEMGKKEKKGIKLKTSGLEDEGIELDPEACRLACMVKATGPVSVEFLGNTDV